MVFFGSYAKKNFTIGSDVDLLIVYKSEERADANAIVKKSLDIPHLDPHLYSEEAYKRMERLIDKMSDGGIVIFPEEPPKLQ